jgi:Ca2+-binding RTX toxin-like protein
MATISGLELTGNLTDPVLLEGTAEGDDILSGDGNDTIYGFEGDDLIGAGGGSDLIFAGDGDDGRLSASLVVAGDTGNDTLYGEAGNDQLSGGRDNDLLIGDNFPFDVSGDDVLNGDVGDDTLIGGSGDDQIDYFEEGNDLIFGNGGEDDIKSGSGNDTIYGGKGSDIILAGEGNDFILGDLGADELTGDDGNDTFVLRTDDPGAVDWITDFTNGEDVIDLPDGVTFSNISFSTAVFGESIAGLPTNSFFGIRINDGDIKISFNGQLLAILAESSSDTALTIADLGVGDFI